MRIAYREGFRVGIRGGVASPLQLAPQERAQALGVSIADVGAARVCYCNALMHWHSGRADGCAALRQARELLHADKSAAETQAAIAGWLQARGTDAADAGLWLCDGAARDETIAVAGSAVAAAQLVHAMAEFEVTS